MIYDIKTKDFNREYLSSNNIVKVPKEVIWFSSLKIKKVLMFMQKL